MSVLRNSFGESYAKLRVATAAPTCGCSAVGVGGASGVDSGGSAPQSAGLGSSQICIIKLFQFYY